MSGPGYPGVEYRTIPGLAAFYLAGSDGSVWSCGRGRWKRVAETPDRGYLKVSVVGPDGRKMSWRLHRVILEAFVGPRPDGMEARHLNGTKTDNRPDNLTWGTPEQNFEDRRRHGTVVTRETSRWRRLTEDQVRGCIEQFNAGRMIKDIAADLGVDASHVSKILRGKQWPGVGVPPLAGLDARARGAQMREQRKREAAR